MIADTDREFTLPSTMLSESGGYRFQFACSLCDRGYTTGKIVADTVGEALMLARREARPHFNRCHKCERWICDAHYNIDEMMCTVCAPLKEEAKHSPDKGCNRR